MKLATLHGRMRCIYHFVSVLSGRREKKSGVHFTHGPEKEAKKIHQQQHKSRWLLHSTWVFWPFPVGHALSSAIDIDGDVLLQLLDKVVPLVVRFAVADNPSDGRQCSLLLWLLPLISFSSCSFSFSSSSPKLVLLLNDVCWFGYDTLEVAQVSCPSAAKVRLD